MLSRPIQISILFLALAPAARAEPPFPPERLDAARDLIRRVFAGEYRRAAADPATGRELAVILLDQSKEIREEADVRYVALVEARDLAARAGDVGTAFAAIAELSRHHDVPALAMQADAVATALTACDGDAARDLAAVALGRADDAADAGEYSPAVRLAAVAGQAAAKAGDRSLQGSAEFRAAELARARDETARLQPFLDRLARDPADGPAHLEVGKSWCFLRDDWERGLPHLARGGDPALSALAEKDLAEPREPAQQAALAEGWRGAASRADDAIRPGMLRRALQWYRRAAPRLEGDAQKSAKSRAAELTKVLPPQLCVTDVSREVARLTGHTGEVLAVGFAPDGRHAVSAGADGTVRLWDLTAGKQLRAFGGHTGPVLGVAAAPDGKFIVSGGQDRTVRLWDAATGREVRRFEGATDYVNNVAVSPDGELIAAAGQDQTVRLWQADTGKPLHTLRGSSGPVFGLAFAPDGRTLAAAGLDSIIRLWDVNSGEEVRRFEGHTGQVLGLDFSPDGKKLLSGGEDMTVRLWDAGTGKEIRRFTGHTGPVGAVAFAPDGVRFLSASDDRTLRLWDAESGEPVRLLTGHTDAVYRADLSPDGRRAASGGLDGTVRLWGERH